MWQNPCHESPNSEIVKSLSQMPNASSVLLSSLLEHRASLEYLKVAGHSPDIIHVHEWQTAAVPMLFWDLYHSQGPATTRLIFTIHNLDSQGECRQEEFAATGVSICKFAQPVPHPGSMSDPELI